MTTMRNADDRPPGMVEESGTDVNASVVFAGLPERAFGVILADTQALDDPDPANGL